MQISQRAQNIISSPIRKFLPLVLKAEKAGVKVFKLNVGDPDIPVSESFWKELKKYKSHNIPYAPSPGIKEHVISWTKYYKSLGIILNPENIIPTVGGAEAILFAIMVVADPGDEMIIFEPLYASYKGFASMCGIKLIPITLSVENNFSLPQEKVISQKITKKTKGIIVINPNNPTGTVLTSKEIHTIIKIAKKFNLFIIADETYREIIFQGKPASFLKYQNIQQHVIVVDSVSKRFSCPGVRIGSIVSHNRDIIQGVLKFAMVRLSAPTLEQHALNPLLKNPKPFIQKILSEYKKRKEIVLRELKKIPQCVFPKPQGAFYIIVRLPVRDADDFVKFLITKFRKDNKTVLVTPAKDFYISKHLGHNEIRIAYVVNSKELQEAMKLLRLALILYLKKHES